MNVSDQQFEIVAAEMSGGIPTVIGKRLWRRELALEVYSAS
jgi:hypothetical protein